MSHFVVAVIVPAEEVGDSPSDVDELITPMLQPFHEYECTGIEDQYVVDVDVTDEVMSTWNEEVDAVKLADGTLLSGYSSTLYRPLSEAELAAVATAIIGKERPYEIEEAAKAALNALGHERIKSSGYGADKVYQVYELPPGAEAVTVSRSEVELAEGSTLESWAEDYGGWKKKGDRFFRKTNPNSKWDWWTVGGRWSGILVDKSGGQNDYLPAGEFDFEARFAKECERQARYYDDLHAELAKHPRIVPWSEMLKKHPGAIDAARTEYHAQPGVVAAKKVERFDATRAQKEDQWDGGTIIGSFMDGVEDWLGDKEIVVQRKAFGRVGFFAILDHEGWHAKGDMGWFGMVHDDDNQDDYVAGAIQRMLDLDPDDLIVAVDCHI